MVKWPNLYYSTSAFAPKHYPKAIIDYANTHGADKIMYAGYFPMGLSLERIMTEMPNVAFEDEVWPRPSATTPPGCSASTTAPGPSSGDQPTTSPASSKRWRKAAMRLAADGRVGRKVPSSKPVGDALGDQPRDLPAERVRRRARR